MGDKHGTVSTYNAGCHCDLCRGAIAKYRREHTNNEARARQVNQKYQLARGAGYSAAEARRRAHWADPLAD